MERQLIKVSVTYDAPGKVEWEKALVKRVCLFQIRLGFRLLNVFFGARELMALANRRDAKGRK
jgi:hypothetical protein